jgi:hypothetical protein
MNNLDSFRQTYKKVIAEDILSEKKPKYYDIVISNWIPVFHQVEDVLGIHSCYLCQQVLKSLQVIQILMKKGGHWPPFYFIRYAI